MRSTFAFSQLKTSRARIHAHSAALIIAVDDADYDEPVVLFRSDSVGPIVTIELDEGDLLFETENLIKAIGFVASIKGRCDFKLSHAGVQFKEEGWADEPPVSSEPTIYDLLKDDDDDPANWWKKGGQQ